MNSWIEQLSSDLFWDVSREEVDPEKHKRWLIERVVQRGRWEDWKLIKTHYSKQEILGLKDKIKLDPKSARFLELYCSSIDFLHHPYPLLEKTIVRNNIRFLSLPDIAAMKINAVTNRGSKKDFTDLLLLHEEGIRLDRALDCFCRKYGGGGRFLAVRSLAWFTDAEEEPDPVYLNGWTWNEVRSRIEQLVKDIIR